MLSKAAQRARHMGAGFSADPHLLGIVEGQVNAALPA